jgi:hypothetical protein
MIVYLHVNTVDRVSINSPKIIMTLDSTDMYAP